MLSNKVVRCVDGAPCPRATECARREFPLVGEFPVARFYELPKNDGGCQFYIPADYGRLRVH